MRDVIRGLIETLESAGEAVLCQVVETRGSTPQKAGALMLVREDGGQVGTLGGGCVEHEVKLEALRRRGQTGAGRFEFVLDHDYAWADGLICGGKMVILAESLKGPAALAYYRAYLSLIEAGEGLTEAAVVDPARVGGVELGTRYLFDHHCVRVASLPAGLPPTNISFSIVPLEERPRSGFHQGVATLPTLPRIRLVIVGAGHVGQAVADLAAQVDFEVWVVDDRVEYANAERFPRASRLLVGPIDEVLSTLEVTKSTYALIVTRGHGHDQEALYYLAPTVAPYVGLIGSRRKIRLILEGLREAGVAEDHLARVSAPVGLDIGSQTVPEIAVSIVAELIARRNLGRLPSKQPGRHRSASMAESEA
jgi:xanthine dehydrogenase accessory factor